jgi:acyl dehydratase
MARSYRFPVDRSAILLFAAALGETNRIYYDDAYAAQTPLGGVIAPPTFGVASHHWDPDFPLRGVRRIPPSSREPAESPAESRGSASAGSSASDESRLARALHGEQRFEYHQPIRPGTELTLTNRAGRSWEKQGKRGGRLRFSETITEYRDEQGRRVLTAISVGIITEKAVEDA